MQVVENEKIICFDVDDTLVMWDYETLKGKRITVTCPYGGSPIYLSEHEAHTKLLKLAKARGATIVVWSQGGYKWAEAVVHALGLSHHVDLVMTKPGSYVDDSEVSKWLTERVYLTPGHAWGRQGGGL